MTIRLHFDVISNIFDDNGRKLIFESCQGIVTSLKSKFMDSSVLGSYIFVTMEPFRISSEMERLKHSQKIMKSDDIKFVELERFHQLMSLIIQHEGQSAEDH